MPIATAWPKAFLSLTALTSNASGCRLGVDRTMRDLTPRARQAAMVLPLATTYAVCGVFGWERGLDHSYRDARAFYILYGGQIALSSLIVLIPGIPLFPLMWLTQVTNAVLLPVTMVLMLRLANNPELMQGWKNGRLTNVLAIGLSVPVAIATVALFIG